MTQPMHARLDIPEEIEEFQDKWLRRLYSTPWADLEEVENTFYEQNAVLIPMYVIQYEASNKDGEFWLETSTTRNEDIDGHKPSEESVAKALQIIGLNYAEFLEWVIGKDEPQRGSFHDKYWKGHVASCRYQPELPRMVKLLIDRKIEDLYSNQTQSRVTPQTKLDHDKTVQNEGPWTDWAVMISLRIDKLFTNENIIVSMNITCYDNCATAEGFWPIPEYEMMLWPGGAIHKLGQHFDHLMGGLYGNKENKDSLNNGGIRNRLSLDYQQTEQDRKPNKWFQKSHAILSNNGVCWEIQNENAERNANQI